MTKEDNDKNQIEVYDEISKQVFEDIKFKLFKEIIGNVFNSIYITVREKNIEIENKKEYNSKYFYSTIELIFEKLKQENKELFGNDDLIDKLNQYFQKNLSDIKKKFCTNSRKYKKITQENNSISISNNNNNNNNNIPLDFIPNIPLIPSIIIFCKDIPNAIEYPYNTIDKGLITKYNKIKYHFFKVNFNYEGKMYKVIYAEKNKYTKREVISIYIDNILNNKINLPYQLKEKYDFY
ncbi:hypothetical protein BCR32DRAFT_303130 [Anaeromyces robustus]|uniref:Uncharacterized protein n=1 Tax=Anaeromyces robustus TaxID=1754192 RepID=A0A1Y1WU00_9FUNG|nr:hypothetical protein BCR32DRAFT_303130 [Anaeromyces robustus]|eukprot:ORX76788.1 hypothetical protein BCR32DRAFT_303130 [Anaeromyces robustus]